MIQGGNHMARYIAQYQFDGRFTDIVFNEIKAFLEYEGFEYTEYKGEYVFQRGEGWITSPTFVKIGFNGNLMQLETWLKYAIFPDVFVGEIGLDSFIGFAVKKKMKKAVATIPAILQKYPFVPQCYQQPVYNAPKQTYAQPAYAQPTYAPQPSQLTNVPTEAYVPAESEVYTAVSEPQNAQNME